MLYNSKSRLKLLLVRLLFVHSYTVMMDTRKPRQCTSKVISLSTVHYDRRYTDTDDENKDRVCVLIEFWEIFIEPTYVYINTFLK